MKIKISVSIIFIISLFITVNGKTFYDDLGFKIEISSRPERIISLAPNLTEILFALELNKNIVGVTRYCDYPPETLFKQKVGGVVDINIEKIKFLNPDLVLAFRGNRLDSILRLKQLKIKVFVLDSKKGIEGTFSLIKKIGAVTFREKEAQKLIEKLKAKYKKLRKKLSSVNNYPKVFLSLHGKELWTCGKKSFLNKLILEAKAQNIACGIPKSWIKYNKEKLLYQNPEIIIILAKKEKDFKRAEKWWKKDKILRKIDAVRYNRIFYINEDLLSRQGPRLIDGFTRLAEILHPEIFNNKN
ncbi:helical backbone metal receptor [SCandidatus Aminicenantes bacterium Aminicenantia_JdfR_composite]|jgi:iron complex transport system substrate-binding protein|nr:helical backbone metal receptor [SCandidatus Aminicenantes bacterium Aminicenantia_JdfR_composite]MCP2620829.1 helical backbone metal receptor [Candidatus Aminicenantes bacterium AC-334-E05]